MYTKIFILFLVAAFVSCEDTAPGPQSVENDIPKASPPAINPAVPSQPLQPSPVPAAGPVEGLTGTKTETKNPDGSVTTVSHFKGQLPQSFFNPYQGAWQSPYLYPFGFPMNPAGFHPYFNPAAANHFAPGQQSGPVGVPGQAVPAKA